MTRPAGPLSVSLRAAAVVAALVVAALGVSTALAAGQSFGVLASGFTQTLFGVSAANLGGTASAPNGDTLADECAFSGSPLHRFDSQRTVSQDSSSLHTESIAPSNAGCGLTNHPDGTLYSNASFGIGNLDPNTAALVRKLGVPGNALGIAVDPQTNHLVYVAADCRFTATCSLFDLDPTTNTTTKLVTLSSAVTQIVDGIAFDPTGNYLFLANRSPQFRLTILARGGSLVQHVQLLSEPDGIAVHGSSPSFVVTNNTDGTLTRVDFPNGYTAAASVSPLASGGFRGDLASVGQDGCLYVTQAGARFDDGTTSTQNSLVHICGSSDFSRPPGVPTLPPTIPPSCALTLVGTNVQGQRYLQITVRNAQDGLNTVKVTTLINLTAQVGSYKAGITSAPTTVQIPDHTLNPVVITATRVNQTLPSQLALQVTDVANNVTSCDPILTEVGREPGVPRRETFHHVSRAESLVTVYNDRPGVTNLALIVDGRRRDIADLKDGEVRTLDVSDLMRRGDNVVTLEALGKPGGSATVMIWDK